MSSPRMEEDGVLREWAPLSKFLLQIPLRFRIGLFLEDVKFTCVDADSECIAIGTNVGIAYWYDRRTHVVQQLKPENNKYSITCVKVVTSVEYMVAVGDNAGVVTIFRLPKQLPDWVLPKRPEHIERYTVDDLHKSFITSLAWSTNGQKLFSGDSLGSVVYTEIDYCMSLSRTCEILNEKYKIYQLCYNQHEQILIVATELRCIICHYNKPNWRIVQVGQRERHNLLELGGCFFKSEDEKLGVYSCRGGLRMWKADLEGNVKNTIMFKNVINTGKETVRLLRPPLKLPSSNSKRNLEFGRLNYWKDGLFVSYRKECLLVLDPGRISVTCCLTDLATPLTDVALTQGELFVIIGERDLIRLAYAPDTFDSSVGGYGNLASGEPVTGLPKFDFNPIIGSVLVPHFIPPSRIKLSASTANTELSANEVTYGTDSTSLLPPVVALREGVPELRLESSRNHQFSAIGQQEFDEIIFTKRKQKKSSKKKRRNSVDESKNGFAETTSGACRNSWSCFQTSKKPEVTSLNGDHDNEKINSYKLPEDIQPDMRTLDAIVKDLKEKELILDATLVFPTPKEENEPSINSTTLYSRGDCYGNKEEVKIENNEVTTERKKEESIFANGDLLKDHTVQSPKKENIVSETLDEFNEFHEERVQILNSTSDSAFLLESIISEPLEDDKNNTLMRVVPEISELSQDSISSQEILPNCDIISLTSSSGLSVDETSVLCQLDINKEMLNCNIDSATFHQLDNKSSTSSETEFGQTVVEEPTVYPFKYKSLQEEWYELSSPDKAVSMSNDCDISNRDTLLICSPGLVVYAFYNEKWSKLPYKANSICISADRDELGVASAVRLHCSIAYYSNDWKSNESWKIIGRNVDWVTMAESRIWFVSNGELFLLPSDNVPVEKVPCPKLLSKVYANKLGVFAITNDNRLLSYDGVEWMRIKIPRTGAKYLAVGQKHLLCLVDQNNSLYVTQFFGSNHLLWWQVFFGEDCLNDIASICTSKNIIYISSTLRPAIYYNHTYVVGHRWETCNLDVECVQICAEGVFEDKGSIWVLAKGNRLYSISPSLNEKKSVPSPCNIICLASSSQALWILSDEGEIFVREGITNSNAVGNSWRKLSLEQFERKVQLSHVSCGCDVVWACDLRGHVVMVVGSPYDITTYVFPPAWVYAEGKPIQNNTFNKVYVGPQSHMVWALDSAGNVYAREAIFPDYLLGTGWVLVPGINALQLSISTESVYAMCREGVYKRIGITQSNYIGDVWLLMPVKLDFISVTVNEDLWGISSNDGRLMRHSEKMFSLTDQVFVEKDWALL